MDKTDIIKHVWAITDYSCEPEICELIKQTKKQSKIKQLGINGIKTISNENVYQTFEQCKRVCIRKSYDYLSVHAKSCADMLIKIERLEGMTE